VIDDDGVVVWESNTIVRYLAASRGRTDLLPTQPAARAHVEQWMDWQGSDFNNSWRVAFQGLVRKNPAFQDRAALEVSMTQLNAMVGIVDAQLARTGAYVAGDTFTVAILQSDCHCVAGTQFDDAPQPCECRALLRAAPHPLRV